MKSIVPRVPKANRLLVPFAYLAIGLALSTTAAVFAFRTFDADEAQRFNEAVDEIHGSLQSRLDFFTNTAAQLAAVYAINPKIKPNEFINFSASTGIRAHDVGVYSYGIFRRVRGTTQEHDRYYLQLRELGSSAPKAVAPIGTEVTNEKERVELFKNAIDAGTSVFSSRIPQLAESKIGPGQMLAIAAYEDNIVPETVEQRRQKAIGVAFTRFSESSLFDRPLESAGPYKAQLDLQIYDGPVARIRGLKPLYEHVSSPHEQDLPRTSTFEIKVGGKPFAVRVNSNQSPLWSTATYIAILVLALGVAASLLTFRILRERERRSEELVKSERHLKFLEGISSILATSLDTTVVGQMLSQTLLALCDWCVIELLNEDGHIDRHLWAASSPERYERLKKFYEIYPPDTKGRRLTTAVREKRATQYIQRVSDEVMKPWIPDDVRRRRVLEVGFESIVIVPLVTQDRVLGTMALYSGDAARTFTPADVHVFEEIALRSSLAFENARLYTESQNLNNAKDHFLAMLSHELRTPMNVILGWLEILTTEEVDEETYTQALDTLNRNAKVQIQLINDLLDVSRVLNGKLTLHAARTDVGGLASGALDSIQPAVRAKQISTTLKTEGDLAAMIDAERIQQVLWNLLSNAVKFTPSGGGITVSVSGSAHEITMTLKDTGIGIDTEFLPFVFDRFRQEESGLARTQGGLGLGLSIVRYIVEGHGGTVTVTSEGRGHGTTFTVVLPKVSLVAEASYLTESVP